MTETAQARLHAVRTVMRRMAARKAFRSKTAGEVRFIKDKSGDASSWGWQTPGASERTIEEDFAFDPKHLKPLAKTLRAALLAMGHALSAHAEFIRIKSAQISPDGALGGKGYIQKIPDMRKQLMNVCEALSSVTDTLYDEIKAPHWNPAIAEQGRRERNEVKDIMTDVEEIRSDPEGVAEKEEETLSENDGNGPSGKYAHGRRI